MVDPNNVTLFERSAYELEEYLLFAIVVAGKKASTQAKLLQQFLYTHADFTLGRPDTPFDKIRMLIRSGEIRGSHAGLLEAVKNSKLGQYTRLTRCFTELIEAVDRGLDIRTCSPEELERIHGIGFKTSRFFIVHSRPNVRAAVIDTHILKFLKDVVKADGVPISTPGAANVYRRLENQFLDYIGDLNPAEVDLAIWTAYSQKQPIQSVVDAFWTQGRPPAVTIPYKALSRG